MRLFDTWQLWCVLRMVIAGICGGIIGLERTNRAKEAGVRTHFVVAYASALMMIVSKYGFADLTVSEAMCGVGADGARLAAQVVSGIGFLGAGMIFVQKRVVTGLTTAAGIWAVSGIGMAIGGGMYILGVCCSLVIVIIQVILHKKIGFLHLSFDETVTVLAYERENIAEDIVSLFESENIHAVVAGFKKEGETLEINLSLTLPQGTDLSAVMERLIKAKEIKSVKTPLLSA